MYKVLEKAVRTRRLAPALGGTSSTAAEPAPAAAPETQSPLIDMSHFMGLPMSSIQKLFLIAYHPSGPGSLAQSLKELQAIFLAGENVAHQSHTLLGASRTAGANVLAQELKAFKRDPTAAALEAMWITLDATRERMSVEGHLPPDAFEAKSA